MICKCGGNLHKRISDDGRAFECVGCGRYEVKTLAENIDFEQIDYSLPDYLFQPRMKPFEDIGSKLITLRNKRKQFAIKGQ